MHHTYTKTLIDSSLNETMASLTYSGVVAAPFSALVSTSGQSPIINATITAPPGTSTPSGPAGLFPATVEVILTLQNDVTKINDNAYLIATFPSPWWSLNPTISDLVPVFGSWTTGKEILATAAPMSLITNAVLATVASLDAGSTGGILTSSVIASAAGSGSPSSTRAVPTTSHISAQGFSKSAMAGVGIGCLVAGLLIAGVFAFFFLRRRRRSSKSIGNVEKHDVVSELHGQPLLTSLGVAKGWGAPQSESDKTISLLANRTLDSIELFVEEFYTDKAASLPENRLSTELSYFETPYLPTGLRELLPIVKSPTILIKHAIAHFLLQKIDPSSNGPQSLLPREFVTPRSPIASSQGKPER